MRTTLSENSILISFRAGVFNRWSWDLRGFQREGEREWPQKGSHITTAMMKAMLFSAVVLGLLATGWTAPTDSDPVCQKLSKPLEKDVDLKGTWYVIAVSTERCWQALLVNLFFWPSFSLDITPKGAANTYDAQLKMKIYGFCVNETETYNGLIRGQSLLDGTPAKEEYLYTDCPDCVVVKQSGSIMFMSRRTAVTADELTQFQKQAECLGWSKVQVLNADHGKENCKDINLVDDMSSTELEEIGTEIGTSFGNRLCDMFLDLLVCFFRTLGLTCIG